MASDRPDRQTMTHHAMATVYKLTLVHGEPAYARQAAAEAFAELNRIEGRLSRYVESSDVFRINRLSRGQSTVVHLDTFDCLRVAVEIQQATAGAFDVAYGSAGPWAAGARFELDPESHTVRLLADGVRLDLGGIGKGFALDRMAALLAEWEIDSGLLRASTSTLLALGPPPGEPGWPVRVGADDDPVPLRLARWAVSASGTSVKGSHVIDPRTGRPAAGHLRAWAVAPTGAVADALSTAFLVMTHAEVQAFCRAHLEVSAHLVGSGGMPSTAQPAWACSEHETCSPDASRRESMPPRAFEPVLNPQRKEDG
jgi:thiamine biosynthesis lipoprotein